MAKFLSYLPLAENNAQGRLNALWAPCSFSIQHKERAAPRC